MNAVLGWIASTAHELAHFHSRDDGIYLAYSDFRPYLLADSSCMKELNQWFVKQLDTGPYRLVAEEGKSKCSWVNLDDISIPQCKVTVNFSHFFDLRIITLQWVEAQVENAKQQAILVTLKGQVSSDEAHIHLDLHSLRYKITFFHSKHIHCSFSQTIPNLCWELAQLQDTYILQGRCLALNQAASDVQEQGAVDDRDAFLYMMHKVVGQRMCLHQGLCSRYPVFNQTSCFYTSDLDNALPEDRNRCINELCTLIQSLQQLLFASSTTAQPILTPLTLMKELDEMAKMNAKLSAAVEELTREHNKKNEVSSTVPEVDDSKFRTLQNTSGVDL
ncbi:hypothetical protein E3N88_44753 [Mikania micrantha]|uniref:HAUS augmin-like complex subunit 3 N-terminal domain-containing protein n=1 Tax=Mikania micrantha TaxID=192012 RepID=A0A5N6LB46_9ASTR|nr:hypothetical protein E3N88_44753 [Mikania micrantha]